MRESFSTRIVLLIGAKSNKLLAFLFPPK